MTTAKTGRGGWRRVSLTAAFVFLAVAPLIVQSGGAASPSSLSTLTTVLADLARAIPQDRALTFHQRSGQSTRITADSLPRSARDAMEARRLRIDASNGVQVYVLMDEVTDDNLHALVSAGASIEITDAGHRRVQARVPASRLAAVGELPFVTFIRLPLYPVRRVGSVNTEGDAILHSDAVRSQLALDGTGVKIGVISDGLKGVFSTACTTCSGALGGPISTGDLPTATGTRTVGGVLTTASGGITGRTFSTSPADLEGIIPGCSFAGAGAEGTALLEIVHDIAPGAQLSFANFDTDLSFNQAVNFLAANNDVVVDDIGFYGDAYDGTSSVSSNTAAALNNPANRIRAYVTAVGNASDEHYIGAYTPSSVPASTYGIGVGGHLHQFQGGGDTTDILGLGPQPYNLIKLPLNGTVLIFLTWNDPFGGSGNNYDLYLVSQTTGAVVASSTDPQTGTQDPSEFISYTNRGAADNFLIVVQNRDDKAAPKDLNIFSFQPECAPAGPLQIQAPRHERHNYNTASRSVSAQSDAAGSPVSVISAGAICSASQAAQSVFAGRVTKDESCLDTSNSTIEFFSSIGPTIDGRTKPDVSGIDGVSVTGAGSFDKPFFGTSAAAPHVAGIAALALQAAPCLVSGANGAPDAATARARLRDLVVSNAVPLGDPNIFGAGLANALASVQAALPVFKGSSTVTVPGTGAAGASVSAAQLGFADPSRCPVTTFKWTGGCGTSPGTTLNCPLGATNLSVSASNNGVAYSTPVSVQVVVTSFALAGTPGSASVTAGQSATYQVNVASQNGPFPSAVTLGCANLPPQASCSFNPPVVTPGATSAQSTLTISTTAPRATASGKRRLAGAVLTPSDPRLEPDGPRLKPGTYEGWFRLKPGTYEGWFGLAASGRRFRPSGRDAVTLVACAGLLALAFGSFRRRHPAAIGAASLVLALVILQVACGSNNNNNTPGPKPGASLSPTSLTFGTQFVQTTSAAQTVTLTSSGQSTLTISQISATGDFAQTNTCGTSLVPQASCTISVTFSPTAAGQRTGTLSIVDNASNSPQVVALVGTAQAANGTPAGSYQVGITGAAGTLVQSGTVTLVVR